MHSQTDVTPLKLACLKAARESIAEQGIEQLSLREVARRLGVSHQAPYRHYASRDHLLVEVIRQCFRDFAGFLDLRGAITDPHHDLAALGARYLDYARQHPVEYRLMFGTPWPAISESLGLGTDAVRAFDILRQILRRLYGEHPTAQPRVDLDAMFIWANMHGLASITQSDVMSHLGLPASVAAGVTPHLFAMLGAALQASQPERPA